MENFPRLKNACKKYPIIELRVKQRPEKFVLPESKAKKGFINKFCR